MKCKAVRRYVAYFVKSCIFSRWYLLKDKAMFGLFAEAKVKATCLADALYPMQDHASVNLHKLSNKENIELQEKAYAFLTGALGSKRNYHSYEMTCATWLALLRLLDQNPFHSFAHRKTEIERGLRSYNTVVWDEVLQSGLGQSFIALIKSYENDFD